MYDGNGNTVQKPINSLGNSITINNAYDSRGRIIETKFNNSNPVKFYYENEQLSSTDCSFLNYSELYSYDDRGNIISKEVYDYTDGDIENKTPDESTYFYYDYNGWTDLLYEVNGTALTYDANGNVLTYGDREFSWNTGRHLESITDGENEYTYTYDDNGIRTSKTANGTTTYYNTMDGVILSQTDGTNTMYFQYDDSGVPIGFIYNDLPLFYRTNQNGDVIALAAENGFVFANYKYDAWGRTISIDIPYGFDLIKEIAAANPIRYRGYYLDNKNEGNNIFIGGQQLYFHCFSH